MTSLADLQELQEPDELTAMALEARRQIVEMCDRMKAEAARWGLDWEGLT